MSVFCNKEINIWIIYVLIQVMSASFQLSVLNFYPFVQRFLQPHQRGKEIEVHYWVYKLEQIMYSFFLLMQKVMLG